MLRLSLTPCSLKRRESGDGDSRVYWGTNFLTVNVDNGDQPVNIDIRPGKYNATQLAAEVERAINEAYGDDSKIQIVQNVDDTLNINLFKLNQDGSSTGPQHLLRLICYQVALFQKLIISLYPGLS